MHNMEAFVCTDVEDSLKFSRLNEYENNTSNEVLWRKRQPHRLPIPVA